MDKLRTVAPELIHIINDVTEIILGTSNQIRQTQKWGWPTFEYEGILCSLVAHKNHINLQFFKGIMLDDPEGILKGTGKEMRHITLNSKKDIQGAYIRKLVRSAMSINREKQADKSL